MSPIPRSRAPTPIQMSKQRERAPGVADRPQPEEHLADPRRETQPPQRDLVTEGDAAEDVGRPLDQEVPGDEQGEDADGLVRRHERSDPRDEEEHGQQGVGPPPSGGHQHLDELGQRSEQQQDAEQDAHRRDGRGVEGEDDEGEQQPQRAGDEEQPSGWWCQPRTGVDRVIGRSCHVNPRFQRSRTPPVPRCPIDSSVSVAAGASSSRGDCRLPRVIWSSLGAFIPRRRRPAPP